MRSKQPSREAMLQLVRARLTHPCAVAGTDDTDSAAELGLAVGLGHGDWLRCKLEGTVYFEVALPTYDK